MEALRPLAGRFASVSSAYVAAQTFRFREGLNETPLRAPKFYGVIAFGILIGILMNLLRIDPIKVLFWCAVFNGITAVPILAVIVWLASNRPTGRWRSSPIAHAWGWATVALMGNAVAAMFWFAATGV